MIFTGVLLGKEATLGFAVGINVIGTFYSLQSLIIGASLRNARSYMDCKNTIISFIKK